MTGESLATPNQLTCNHKWKKVDGATGPKGEMVVMCEKCSASRHLSSPVKENVKDSRPILLE
jgi:hypothetical protein